MKFKTFNKQYLKTKELAEITKTSLIVLEQYKPHYCEIAKDGFINLNFISDQEIQFLNEQYREKSKPTDVLSWGFFESQLLPHEAIGEIYISVDTLKRQAKEKNHPIRQELIFLIVHGLLHIFEYDHQDDLQELEMDNITNEIISALII
jgi:probable rRNA maturation factor